MKRDSSAVILLELAASHALSYTALSPHDRQRVRMIFWRVLQQLASFLAFRFGRLAILAETRYAAEVLV